MPDEQNKNTPLQPEEYPNAPESTPVSDAVNDADAQQAPIVASAPELNPAQPVDSFAQNTVQENTPQAEVLRQPQSIPQPIPQPQQPQPTQTLNEPEQPQGTYPVNPVPVSPIDASANTFDQGVGAAPKKSKKPLIIGIVIAAVLVLLGGGSALAYSLWYQNPEKVVTDAAVHALTAKTVAATGVLEYTSKDNASLKVEISGRNSLEAHSTVAVKLAYKAEKIDLSVDAEGVFSAEGDLYVKLNKAEELAKSIETQSNGQLSLAAFDTVIKKIDSRWIKITKDDLGEYSQEYKKTQQCVADVAKKLESDGAFRKKAQQEVEALYKKHPLVTVGEKLGSRTINGQGSLGYTLVPSDNKTADAFFTGMGDTEIGKAIKECDSSIKYDEIVDGDASDNDDKATTTFEIWVSRFGHEVTELKVSGEEGGNKGSFVLNPVFNKNEAVAIPGDSIPLSELKSDIEKTTEEYYSTLYSEYEN